MASNANLETCARPKSKADSLDLTEFAIGFLEFFKQQSDTLKPTLITHLLLLMERSGHYTWPSVRSFHLAIPTAIEQHRLTCL